MAQAAIGVHVLAEQGDFAHAALRQAHHLGEHVVERTAEFFAACVRYYAEATVLAAAFHNRDQGARSVHARLRQAVELLDFRKRHIHRRATRALHAVYHLRQAMQGLRAEHHVHVRRAPTYGGALLAGDTAADADNQLRAQALEFAP